MSVYSLKVSVKNNPDVYRIIDVDASHPLIVLHKAILNSIKFEDGELASFYQNYESKSDREEYCLTEMQIDEGASLMKDVCVQDVLQNQGERLTYVYDFLNMWVFDVYLEFIRKERTADEKLPRVIESAGDNPKQEMFGGFDEKNLTDDDMMMLKNLIEKNDDLFDSDIESKEVSLESFDDIDDYSDELSGFESLDSLEEDYTEEDNW